MSFEALVVAAVVLVIASLSMAQSPAEGAKLDWPRVGKIAPRHAKDIAGSDWSIGTETLDRDFADYAKYRDYLGPLGAKHARFQAGWAKCEKTPGDYDFKWLDGIIDDCIAQGVQPWLQTSYGNPIYPQGGGTHLGEGLPKSPEALAAWDKWVKALVQHYKSRVTTWEIWNEPDLKDNVTPTAYAGLFIRTAEIIRAEQPTAKIYALGLAGKMAFAEEFFKQVRDQNKLGLIDAVTIHGYPLNPDDTSNIGRMKKLLAEVAPNVTVRQGETGAPSTEATAGALSKHPFTELKQAKWNLRRMLAHRAIDVPFSLFTLMDLKYKTPQGLRTNSKGILLKTDDGSVARPKPAYYAAQHVFAIFDDTVTRLADYPTTASAEQIAVYGYAKKDAGQIVTVWNRAKTPGDANDAKPVDLTLRRGSFKDPVYVDLLSGAVYEIPKPHWRPAEGGCVFTGIPVYDSPILIAERAALPIKQ